MVQPNYLGSLYVQPDSVTTVSPTTANDATQGYQVGSRWLNTATGNEYVCVDATAAAAVWQLTTTTASAETANTVYAAPNGSSGAPTFRALVAADFGTQTKNTFLAGPTTGANAAPTFRALVAADVTPALQNLIADPGNAGVIPVTATGSVLLVTAGAETRTIAAAAAVGIVLLLNFETKVGNCVVTVASTINATGNNTISLTAVGQSIALVSVRTSVSAFRWAVQYNDGTTLTTV